MANPKLMTDKYIGSEWGKGKATPRGTDCEHPPSSQKWQRGEKNKCLLQQISPVRISTRWNHTIGQMGQEAISLQARFV